MRVFLNLRARVGVHANRQGITLTSEWIIRADGDETGQAQGDSPAAAYASKETAACGWL